MIQTEGLTHLHFAVSDLERSLRFYQSVFGMQEQFRAGPHMIFLQTPGGHDMITLHGDPEQKLQPGQSAGIAHFGFNLTGNSTLDTAVEEVKAAGGTLMSRGEHGPGSGYAYVADPDGYVIELMSA